MIVYDYFRLFCCKNRLFRYYCIISQKTIISLIALRLFHFFCSAFNVVIMAIILRLFALFLSQDIIPIILFEMHCCDYFFQSQLLAL